MHTPIGVLDVNKGGNLYTCGLTRHFECQTEKMMPATFKLPTSTSRKYIFNTLYIHTNNRHVLSVTFIADVKKIYRRLGVKGSFLPL